MRGSVTKEKPTGVLAYDCAQWHETPAEVSHVVPNTAGLGFLIQKAPQGGFPDGNHVVFPESKDILVKILPRGAHLLEFRIDDAQFSRRVFPYSAIVVPSGVRSWWLTQSPGYDFVVHLHICSEKIAETAYALGRKSDSIALTCTTTDAFLLSVVSLLSNEAAQGHNRQQLAWEAYSTLVQTWLLGLNQNEPIPSGALAPWQARRAVDFLNEHFDQQVELATLAGLCELSAFHFARSFKRSMGVPPHRYQLRLRLEKAKQLLLESDLGVLDVAVAVGYETAQPLCRLFQKHLGISPAQYRRIHRP